MHKRGYDMQDLNAVLKRLIEKKLLQSDRDHKWHGSYKKKRNIRELHINLTGFCFIILITILFI